MTRSSAKEAEALFKSLLSAYSTTITNLKIIDLYVLFAVLSAILQVVYMALVGSFPFNSFLSGTLSCIGTAILAVCLRIQVNPLNKEFKDLPPQRAFADFVLCNLVLHLGLRGLYAGFFPAVLGSSLSWGLYFFFYSTAKNRYLKGHEEQHLSPGLHLISAAEAGALVSFFTNPVWLVKTRLQLQTPLHQTGSYLGFSDAFRTILRGEGWRALYRGLGPGLLLVSHGAIQFTVYEELRKIFLHSRTKVKLAYESDEKILNSADYALLGASSKLAAMLMTYPYQVIRSRIQQRPSSDGTPKYMDSWHVVKETARYEGLQGFYRGLTSNILKNVPAASITFVVYENVLNLLSFRSNG